MTIISGFRRRFVSRQAMNIKDQTGQAMAEFVVFSPILVLILIAIMFFGKGYYMKQKCYTAARYCAWYCGRHVDGDQELCKATTRNVTFRGENTDNLTFNGPIGWSSDDDFDLGGILNLLSGLNQAEKYQVKFLIHIPNVLSFMGTQRVPGNIHTVVADCWDWLNSDSLMDDSTADSGVDDAPISY